MRRLISMVFVLAVLALVSYSAWQVSLLKREVAALKTEVAALKAGKGGASEASGTLSLIAKAREHAERAKEHIRKGDLKRARTELDKSLQLMQRAGQDAGAPYRDALEKVQRTLRDTRATIEQIWRKSDEKPDKAKGG